MKITKLLLLLGAAVAGLVLLAEIGVRLFAPVPMSPPGEMRLTNDIPGLKRTVEFAFDGDHLRKLEWGDDREAGGYRILALGGNSTTAILQNAPDTWWGQLAGDLSGALGKKVGVASPAALGEGRIVPAAVAAAKVLDTYEVDLIIACFGYSDALLTPGDYRYEPGKIGRLKAAKPTGFGYTLAKVSHLLRMVRNSRTAATQSKHMQALAATNYYKNWLEKRTQLYAQCPPLSDLAAVRSGDDPLREYLEGIDELAALAKRHGARLLVVGEPTLYKSILTQSEAALMASPWYASAPVEGQPVEAYRVEPIVAETELERFYRAAAEKCEQLGVAWIKLQGEIPRFSDHFVSESFLSDKGAAAVAAKLSAPVAALLQGQALPADDRDPGEGEGDARGDATP